MTLIGFNRLASFLILAMCGIVFSSYSFLPEEGVVRIINYNGKDVRTTYSVDSAFLGTYKGRKSGYLKLNEDGTGEYRYDIFGPAPVDCLKQSITIEWGFLLDENNKVVKFKRGYGFSYPILYKSTGSTKFQGCREEVMLDFILETDKGALKISSSDDWKKVK
ncbi:MAG: hypothetical protein AAFX87_02900 [Bacteroidota bacterium]